LAPALPALPDAGVRAAVEALAPRKQALDEALRTAQKEEEECRNDLAEADDQLAELPPETDVSALKKTIAAIQKQGALEGQLVKCETAVARAARAARAAQQQWERLPLWQGVVEQVLELQTPLYETVGAFADKFRELEDEAPRRRDREAQLEAERTECQQRLQQLELAGAVPLEVDLTAARDDRDAGWQLIKRRYLLGQEVDLTTYAPDGNVAGRYEGQVTASDGAGPRKNKAAGPQMRYPGGSEYRG
jgi:chromosome segregation ATPase